MSVFNALLSLAVTSLATGFSLPPPHGQWKVGTVSIELIDNTRLDPLAPDTQPRDLMISAFYPTEDTSAQEIAPTFTSQYASYLESTYTLPSGSASTILSQAYASAPLLSNYSAPTLFFSPGYSISRVEYTATLTNIASLGYLVLALDHPFDANFIDYPDGRVVLRRDPTTINWTSPDYVALRAADARFVLDTLSTNATAAQLIPGLEHPIDASRVAMFGHSFGGATTADAMYRDERFRCGVDLDGILFGPVVEAGLDRPFLIMGEEFRNRSVEPSWATFHDASTGWKEEVSVKNVLHIGYSDMLFISQQWMEEGLQSEALTALGTYVGTIDGVRMIDLVEEYLADFWEGCFGTQGWGLLEGPSERWPEVVFFQEDHNNMKTSRVH